MNRLKLKGIRGSRQKNPRQTVEGPEKKKKWEATQRPRTWLLFRCRDLLKALCLPAGLAVLFFQRLLVCGLSSRFLHSNYARVWARLEAEVRAAGGSGGFTCSSSLLELNS